MHDGRASGMLDNCSEMETGMLEVTLTSRVDLESMLLRFDVYEAYVENADQ
jgi:hypothetical protein